MTAIRKQPWLWSFLGAGLVWLAAILFTHGTGAGGMITAALALAVFTVVVGIGQMFVITLGPGNVDLSLPANIGLASAVSMTVMNGSDGRIALGLLAALGCGLLIGIANYLLIRALRIPPIIATLSASFIIQSIDISYGRGLQIKPPPGFADFANAELLGVPVLAILTILFSVAAAIALRRTVYGRSALAIGQNMRAARFAGLRVERTRAATYALCGTLGGLDGALLAGYFRGANVDIGNEYLLASIAVVVIGGTSVAGGKANVPGIWGAALFLVLLLTMLNTFGVSSGVRLLATGLIIVAVTAAAGGEKGAALMAAKYRGVFPVAPTVFDAAGGLDLHGQRRCTDFIIDSGADGMCILANWSEQFALTDAERETVMHAVLDHVAGRVPVIVTTTHFGSSVCAERSRKAEEAGAAMVMVMPPYHGATFRVPEPAIFDFFRTVAEAVTIPVMIQDAPVAGTPLSPAFLVRMAKEIAGIRYFKIETPQAAAKLREMIRLGGDAIEGPWDGEEGITLWPDLEAGATGSMTGAGYPDGIAKIVKPYFAGRREEAIEAHMRWLPLINYENRQCGLQAAKILMEEGGVIKSGAVRHPLVPVHPAIRAGLIETARRLDPLVLRWAK